MRFCSLALLHIMHLWPNARTHTRFFRGRSELVWILATYFFRLFPPEGLWRWNALRSLVPPSLPLAEFRRGGRSCWRERERELGTLGTFLHSLIAPRAVVKWHKAPARVDPPLILWIPLLLWQGGGGSPFRSAACHSFISSVGAPSPTEASVSRFPLRRSF